MLRHYLKVNCWHWQWRYERELNRNVWKVYKRPKREFTYCRAASRTARQCNNHWPADRHFWLHRAALEQRVRPRRPCGTGSLTRRLRQGRARAPTCGITTLESEVCETQRLDEAEEVYLKKNHPESETVRRKIGRILLKGDNISLICGIGEWYMMGTLQIQIFSFCGIFARFDLDEWVISIKHLNITKKADLGLLLFCAWWVI